MLCASEALAFPLRVLAPTELRVAPTVRADRGSVQLDVRLRDDRGAPVQGPIHVAVTGPSGLTERDATTSPRGEASVAIAVRESDRVLSLRVTYNGDDRHASASAQSRLDLDAPFVSVSLLAPAAIDLDGRGAIDLVASVHVAQVSLSNPAGWPVQFYLDGDRVGAAVADATGRATLRLDRAAARTPGVHALRAAVLLRGSELWSPDRRVIVRALTSVIATAEPDARTGALRVHGAVAWRGGGVGGATVRVQSGATLVAAAVSDASGAFDLTIAPRALVAGARARVAFAPTTPWFAGAESAEFLLAPAAPTPVSWRYVVAPIALGLLLLAVLRTRRSAPVADAPRTLADGATIESAEGQREGTFTVRVEDRTTAEPLDDAEVIIDGQPFDNTPRIVALGASVRVKVSCAGFAPRELTVEIDRAGAVRLRVGLSPWREAVYEVAKQHLPRGEGAAVAPTLREAAQKGGATRPLFDQAEHGSYGPTEPDSSTVERLEALSRSVRDREH